MTAFPSLRRLNVSYTLVHVVYWALFAVFAGYQTSLLLGRGFTSGEAGVFASIRCFAGILAQPLLGGWADRHPEVPIKRLLNVCLVLALGVNGVFYATRPGFWGTAVIFLALGILELNAYPLLDSMAVQFIAAGVPVSYSLSRGLGSLSYAVACVLLGQQAAAFGTESLLLTHLALLVLICAYISLARHPERYTLPERLFYLLAFFAFVAYEGLYLFTDMVYYTRYNIPVVVLLMPVGVDYLYRLPRCRLLRGILLGGMAALLLWCGNDYYTRLWPKNMTAGQEAAVTALRVAGYTEGYAAFWNANVMVEMSNGAFDIRVWPSGKDVTDPDNLYEWMQTADHFTSKPEGPVFLFFNKNETEYQTPSRVLDQGKVEYEDENYIALGYPSYDAMRADFFD